MREKKRARTVRRQRRIDITITGTGFWRITGQTPKGRAFMLSIQGNDRDVAFCDDGRLVRAIAQGAVDQFLRVDVNGIAYGKGAQR